MRSRRSAWRWLLAKEWRELLTSRAWWVMLILTGPLVGVSFIGAVRTYAEASGLGGTASGVGEAFSPLVGIWAPTFSAYEVAAVFLLPFAAIRLVAGDRQSGALKLELQQPMPPFVRVTTKAVVLFGGWLIAWFAAGIAVGLWEIYGGSIYPPEIMTVVLGHFLNAGLTIAFAAAAASITEHPSTAAVITFAFTIGTWVLDFAAAVHGGIWERMAAYTPAAMVASFQRGLIRMDVGLIALTFIVGGLGIAAIWMQLGSAVRQRAIDSVWIGALMAVTVCACAVVHASWDVSENRQNSFSKGDETILKQIRTPLRIEAHLAPEDPRRADLERQALSKLRRIMPGLEVEYISATSIGLFEQTSEHYGEVWYDLGGHQAMSRLTTAEGVLATIFGLANVTAPDPETEPVFPGHPLAVPSNGAASIFFVIWPALAVGAAFFVLRRNR